MLYILSLLILTITSKGKQPRLRGVKLLTKSATGPRPHSPRYRSLPPPPPGTGHCLAWLKSNQHTKFLCQGQSAEERGNINQGPITVNEP